MSRPRTEGGGRRRYQHWHWHRQDRHQKEEGEERGCYLEYSELELELVVERVSAGAPAQKVARWRKYRVCQQAYQKSGIPWSEMMTRLGGSHFGTTTTVSRRRARQHFHVHESWRKRRKEGHEVPLICADCAPREGSSACRRRICFRRAICLRARNY